MRIDGGEGEDFGCRSVWLVEILIDIGVYGTCFVE